MAASVTDPARARAAGLCAASPPGSPPACSCGREKPRRPGRPLLCHDQTSQLPALALPRLAGPRLHVSCSRVCGPRGWPGLRWKPARTPTGCGRPRGQVRAPRSPQSPLPPRTRGWRVSSPRISSSARGVRVPQALSWPRSPSQSWTARSDLRCSREQPLRNGPRNHRAFGGPPS